MIQFKNVKFDIDGTNVLTDINCVIPEKKVICFVGRKNTGKSTILKLLGRVYGNYYGEIIVNGKDLYLNDNVKIDIVHDKRERETELTVFEYLSFYADIYGVKDADYENKIDNLLKKYSLMSYKYTNVDTLDNENYKLVDIVRIILNNPDVILFDNVFFSDNVDYTNKILEYLESIKGKKTIIFATRAMNYIDKICDYIGVIDAGTLIAYGTKDEVMGRAELNKKVEVEIVGNTKDAVDVLTEIPIVTNIVYNDSKIVFSLKDNNKDEAAVLKKLIDANINVISFRKEDFTFEQLLGKLRNNE